MDNTEKNVRIILIKRKTDLDKLIEKYNTIAQAKFNMEHLKTDFAQYVDADKDYKVALMDVQKELGSFGAILIVDKEQLNTFNFEKDDIVVVFGTDGLVVNTLKYLSSQLLIGVNPLPSKYDGLLVPFKYSDLKFILRDVLNMKRPVKEVSMAKAVLNDGHVIYAASDIFIGNKSHISSKYTLEFNKKSEYQCSSGIIISTGLGSTGWLKSILIGSASIVNTISTAKIRQNSKRLMPLNADYLYFCVREPFPVLNSNPEFVFGKVILDSSLTISSHMTENGIIFSDGIENDCLSFNIGSKASIMMSEKIGRLVV